MKEFKSFYKEVTAAEGERCRYNTRLDTMGCGCAHDCAYCYAKSLLDFRGLWHPDDPSVADIRKIERKIKKLPEGITVRLGGMTDCFQPIEKELKVTAETIKLLNEHGIHYLIVTKSDLICENMHILDKQLAHVQISTTWLPYEKAVPTERRIIATETLQENGFDVAVRLSPFVPEMVDFDHLNSIGCDKIIVEFLRVNHWIMKWMPLDYTKHTLKSGGYWHLPLSNKLDALAKITGFKELSVCDDVPAHYEYFKKYINSNPDDCCNLRRE